MCGCAGWQACSWCSGMDTPSPPGRHMSTTSSPPPSSSHTSLPHTQAQAPAQTATHHSGEPHATDKRPPGLKGHCCRQAHGSYVRRVQRRSSFSSCGPRSLLAYPSQCLCLYIYVCVHMRACLSARSLSLAAEAQAQHYTEQVHTHTYTHITYICIYIQAHPILEHKHRIRQGFLSGCRDGSAEA